jgi:hypothetical protein
LLRCDWGNSDDEAVKIVGEINNHKMVGYTSGTPAFFEQVNGLLSIYSNQSNFVKLAGCPNWKAYTIC